MELGILTKTAITKRNMNHGVASRTKKGTLVAVAWLCVEDNKAKFTLLLQQPLLPNNRTIARNVTCLSRNWCTRKIGLNALMCLDFKHTTYLRKGHKTTTLVAGVCRSKFTYFFRIRFQLFSVFNVKCPFFTYTHTGDDSFKCNPLNSYDSLRILFTQVSGRLQEGYFNFLWEQGWRAKRVQSVSGRICFWKMSHSMSNFKLQPEL